MRRLSLCFFGGLALLTNASSVESATRYVKIVATGTANCTSWANACALTQAVSVAQDGDSLWVKAGTYPPIVLNNGVNLKIIGGFAGTESSASQSNPSVHVTTINGAGVSRCIYSSGHDSTTVLRGLRFINGRDSQDEHGGGAMFIQDSSPTIVECIFEYNTASYLGGAVIVHGNSSPQFISSVFRYNGVTDIEFGPYEGGAIHQKEGWLTVVNCLFHDNKAGEGGAIWLGFGVAATLTNCTIVENEATIRRGGGVYILNVTSIDNCIMWGNIRHDYFNPPNTYADQLHDLWGFSSVTYSDIQDGWAGTANLNANPLFANAGAGDFKLTASSPCKNAGSNSYLSVAADAADLDWDTETNEDLPLDLARNTRLAAVVVDMGAYEHGCGGAGSDCNQNGVPDPCDIESDPSLDCVNNNGILDLCESVPKGACCIGETCEWPTTSCACAAEGGIWHQGKKCFQVACFGQ